MAPPARPPETASTSRGDRLALPISDEELHQASALALARVLSERLALLARKELELAREEARLELRRGIGAGAFAGAAGVALIAALCCALVAAILAIGHMMDPVWAAVIGAGLFALLGIGLALITGFEARDLKPERSIRQIKETARLFSEPVHP